MIKIVRRDSLLKAALKGKLVAKCRYRYTDDYAHDNDTRAGMNDEFIPVYIEGKTAVTPEGVEGRDFHMWRQDSFNLASGRAYTELDSGITFFQMLSTTRYEVKVLA